MRNIFLAGGGNAEDSASLDEVFVRTLPLNPRVLYIPIALSGADRPYSSCLEWLRTVLVPHCIYDIEMWTDLSSRTLEDLGQFDAVYIGGGNTYSLLKDIQESGFGGILSAYADAGGTLYGGSAGAIILGADIGTCAHLDENRVNLSSMEGLNLIGGVSVWCHYVLENDLLATQYVAQMDQDVIAISEKGGLCVGDQGLSVIGDQAIRFHSKGKSVHPAGTIISV